MLHAADAKMTLALAVYVMALLTQQLQLGAAAPCYPAVFVFGDSLSDTGNGVLTANPFFLRTAQPPYGETVPGTPAKRFSDGLLLVDFLATRVGLPLLKPSLDPTANFNTGLNYAVSGATADSAAKYAATKFILPLTPYSLDIQIGWHLARKATVSPQNPSADAYNNGLYVLEIGGNDYIGALTAPLSYPPATVISTFIPAVISKIRNATEVLYANGARHFLYISITPLGCSPSILTAFPTSPKDANGCIPDINAISSTHGQQLLNLVNDLRSLHADATFFLLDYYGAYNQVLGSSASFGFTDTLDACCGAGPTVPYRYNTLKFCSTLSSTADSTLCANPNVFLNWDGIHFTHKFNSVISSLTFGTGTFLNPSSAFAACSP